MYTAVGVLFWLLFAFTMFMMVNQLMYQEDSLLFSWSQQAIGYWVFAIMVTMWLFIISGAFFMYHMYRDAGAWLCVALMWAVFFLSYNHVISMDVRNKHVAGEFPAGSEEVLKNISDVSREGWLDDTHVTVVINNDKYKDAKSEDRLNGFRHHDYPDSYPTA
ncbi:hypothetical protein AVU38_gp013 [Ralstonia phage RSL2]|uniref:Uncharacterized protein n=1 Tax=Ralstonia phage RSL2 TaxID=1585840 RepID=A0A0A8JB23_9CAUD|nr:hypothetical protein AVU38_gp013 [Ralstonia phage RSL2]BAQ02541.1 hypothetical protein [Ralstonia phage RSL2]